MLPSILLAPLLLLSLGQVTALALFGRQQPRNNATLPLHKRQGTVLVTSFSTIFFTGDPSKVRTANSGFGCRVDVLNGLWGSCPNTVISLTDCGLAGSCVDSFSCSKGCGFTDAPLTTFTWLVTKSSMPQNAPRLCPSINTARSSDSSARYCSTALLTLSNNVGPFSYLACSGGPKTDEYLAFTTTAEQSSSRTQSISTTSTSSAGPKETPPTSSSLSAQGRPTGAVNGQSSTSTSITGGTSNNDNDDSNSSGSSNSQGSQSSPNNTGAIPS